MNGSIKNAYCIPCDGWISVKDRLPDHKLEDVLVATTATDALGNVYRWINIAWINQNGTWSSNDEWIEEGREIVTHWMPLPLPPKEG